jgi:hypothetical protein
VDASPHPHQDEKSRALLLFCKWLEGLKTSINRIFKGVSTRFLPNYLALAKHLRGAVPPLAFLQAAIA